MNVGLPEIDEAEMMVRTVKALQGVTEAPLQLDSTDPKVLEGALRVYCGKAIVNSVNGEEAVLDAILPLVKKYGAAVVGLTLDGNGIPKTVQARMDIARKILDRALSFGLRKEDVYIDCLTLTVSAEPEGAVQTLEGLRRVKTELGIKTVLGVSNISFGLPARPLINQNFLTMAMSAGLDLPILNPNVESMMAAVRCYHLLTNVDENAREFIAAYGNAQVSTSITTTGTAAPAPAAGGRGGRSPARRGRAGGTARLCGRPPAGQAPPGGRPGHQPLPPVARGGGPYPGHRSHAVRLPEKIEGLLRRGAGADRRGQDLPGFHPGEQGQPAPDQKADRRRVGHRGAHRPLRA